MQPHSEHPTLRKGKDVVQEKEAIQEKDEVAVETDPDLTQATKIQVPTPITNPDKKGKERAETKKANRDPVLIPLAIASRKIHAATVAVRATLPEPATNVRMTKRTVRNQHTSKQISTLPLTRQP
jgi:hypothetical protein